MLRRGLALLALSAVLLGCGTAPTENTSGAGDSTGATAVRGGLFSAFTAGRGKPPLVRSVLAGGVVVEGPPGYCIEPRSIGLGRSFAVLASCQVLTEGQGGTEVPLALMTVTVGARDTGARVPDAKTVAAAAGQGLVDTRKNGDMNLALLETGGQEVLPDGEPQYWRGTFVLNDRPVGLALYAPSGSRLKGAPGAALLAELHDKIVDATPSQDTSQGEPDAKPLPQGLFRRLLNGNG